MGGEPREEKKEIKEGVYLNCISLKVGRTPDFEIFSKPIFSSAEQWIPWKH